MPPTPSKIIVVPQTPSVSRSPPASSFLFYWSEITNDFCKNYTSKTQKIYAFWPRQLLCNLLASFVCLSVIQTLIQNFSLKQGVLL